VRRLRDLIKVAFCFYNLSSIVNGLVYFDQFGLIPWQHLLLVASGIIVLLGGVWIVSINSGGGGVDVGTWPEAGEADADSVFDTRDVETGVIVPYNTEQGQSSREPRLAPVPMERETVSESHDADYSSLVFPTYAHTSAPSSPPHERQAESPIVSRPPYGIRTSVSRRRPTLEDAQNHNTTFNALSPTLAGGLSIGLSPASPGFVLVPKERRLRRSIVESLERRPLVRRVVSEGDAFQFPPNFDDASAVEDEHVEEGSQVKSQWGWTRGLFKRRQK
jgi:magnesium transporter